MSDAQYEPLEEFSDWTSGLACRMLVYISIQLFALILMFYGNALFEEEILTEGLEVTKFGLGTIGIVAILTMFADFARGFSYLAVHLTGRHRAYIAVGVVFAVFAAIKATSPAVDYGEFTVAYYRIVWAFSLLIGVEVATAGIYESDVKRLRSVMGI